MFPKFLRVTLEGVAQYPVRINETTVIYKKLPFADDMLKLNAIAEALGFSYKVVFSPDGDALGEHLPNGSWTGVYGMLQRGEADLAFSSNMGACTNRLFHCSYPHSVSSTTFMTRNPEHVPNAAVFLNPFSIPVWLTIIACLCLLPLIFHYLLRKKHSALDIFTSTLRSLVGQGMEFLPEMSHEYIMLGVWILGSALLYYFYSAVLLSFITFPSLHGISTIEDLANGIKDGKYHSTMHPNATYDNWLATIPNPSFQVIANNLQENKGKRTEDYIGFLETSTYDKKPAFVGVRGQFVPYKEFYFISDESFRYTAQFLVMRKDFCCGQDVDKAILRIWASGIFKKLQVRIDYFSLRFYLHTYGKWLTAPSKGQLTMTMLKGPFIFLILFLSLAFFVFLVEVCIGKFKRN